MKTKMEKAKKEPKAEEQRTKKSIAQNNKKNTDECRCF